jgi:ProP effector
MNSQECVDVVAVITRLAEHVPKCISLYEGRRRPLKIGIYEDLVAKVAGAVTPEALKIALRSYTKNIGYLRAMASPAKRIDIEGNPVGAVTPAQSASAAKAVASHWARQVERKKARLASAEPETPPCSGAGGSVSVRPKRLSLGDLKRAALERKRVTA